MTAAQRALGLLPFMRVDPASDAILDLLVTSWMLGVERPAEVAYGEPWVALSDPEIAPLWALPHAALYTGGTMPPRLAGELDDTYLERARAEVINPRGMRRGSWSALAIRIQSTLIATKSVDIIEWVDGEVWQLAAHILADECPDPAATYLAANAPDVIPAGMRVEIVGLGGTTWEEMTMTWDAATGSWDSYA